jgi:hypothetical protein
MDAVARKQDEPDGQGFEQAVIAFEGSSLFVPVPVGTERDLRHFPCIGPAGSGAFGAGGRCAVEEDHVAMAGMNAVEYGPDALMIVAIGTACKGDPGAFGQEDTRIVASTFVEKVTAVDDCRGQHLAIDARARMRGPGFANECAELVGGRFAEKLHRIAAFDEGNPFR